MPTALVPRVLEYVGWLFAFSLASTFVWWGAAQLARAEYRSLLSALACSMRWFFYSICLLCILVAAQSLHLGPADPRSTLLGWIHLAGSVWITIPCAWRAFRQKGPRLLAVVLLAWIGLAVAGTLSMYLSRGFAQVVHQLPRYLARS